MAGRLYIVATPIGNLQDITQRALRVLREVTLVACEDTRHTRKLLNHFGIETKTISYHGHNERERAEELCELLQSGKDIAIVCDAGTPLISDPGFRLNNLAIETGIEVIPLPGASAFVAALSASGLATDQFFFAGFLPARARARRERFDELKSIRATLIFYEAPHRIVATLGDALEVLGDRQAVVARELTKLHEEFMRGTLSEVSQRFAESESARGEMVLLISGIEPASAEKKESASHALVARLRELEAQGLDSRTALKQAARELGLKRDEAYRIVLDQKNRRTR